jgi:hypothetical protein
MMEAGGQATAVRVCTEFPSRQGHQPGGGLTLSLGWIFARLVDVTNDGFIRRIARRRTH